jgi:hypothetical protein
MLDAAANVSLARPLLLLLLHNHFNQNVWQQTAAAQCAKAPRNNNPHEFARLISLSLSQSIPLRKKKDMPDLMKKKKPRKTVLDTKTLKNRVDNNGNNNSRGFTAHGLCSSQQFETLLSIKFYCLRVHLLRCAHFDSSDKCYSDESCNLRDQGLEAHS